MKVQIALELGIEMAIHKQDQDEKVHNFVPIRIVILYASCFAQVCRQDRAYKDYTSNPIFPLFLCDVLFQAML